MSHACETIDPAALGAVTGGASKTRKPKQPATPSLSQIGTHMAAACATGAATASLKSVFTGDKSNALSTAAVGCALGVGTEAIREVGSALWPH